jgi:amino acid transporter
MYKSFGKGAGEIISALIAISVFAAINAMIMLRPRAYFTMAHDRMFFRAFGKLDARNAVPFWGYLSRLFGHPCFVARAHTSKYSPTSFL